MRLMCDTGPLRAEPGSSSTRLRRPSRPGAKRHLETVGADRDHPRAAGPVHAGPVRWDEPVQVRPGASRGMVSLCSGTFKRASSVRSPQGSASAFWNVWTLSCPPTAPQMLLHPIPPRQRLDGLFRAIGRARPNQKGSETFSPKERTVVRALLQAIARRLRQPMDPPRAMSAVLRGTAPRPKPIAQPQRSNAETQSAIAWPSGKEDLNGRHPPPSRAQAWLCGAKATWWPRGSPLASPSHLTSCRLWL